MFIYLVRHAAAEESAPVVQPKIVQPVVKAADTPVAAADVPGAPKEGGEAPAAKITKPPVKAAATVSDENRPLTKDGRKKMISAAQGIERILPAPIDVILSSPLMRARETAQITADVMKLKKKVKLCPELSPGISSARLMKVLAKYKTSEQIMLVGHSPDLNAAAAALLGSDSVTVELKKGAVCCIEIPSLARRTKGKLVWLMQPKQLRQLAK